MARLTSFLMLVFALPALGAVDARLIGGWQLQWAGPEVIWQINADGTYSISGRGAAVPQQGNTTVADGIWSILSPVWADGGTYQLDGDTLLLSGKLGVGTWRRVGQAVAAAATFAIPRVTDAASVPVLPALRVLGDAARNWQADAILESVLYKLSEIQGVEFATITLSFCSPGTGFAYVMRVSPEGTRSDQVRPRGWCTDTSRGAPVPIPLRFFDLPAAVGIARKQASLNGPVSRAELKVWHPNDLPVLAWTLRAGNSATVDAATGAILNEDVTGATEYIASYNAAWEKAAEGLRRLMAPPRRGSAFSDSSPAIGEDPGSSSPAQEGPSTEDYQAEVCRANTYWGKDPSAHDRAQGGSTTWSDTSYGCY